VRMAEAFVEEDSWTEIVLQIENYKVIRKPTAYLETKLELFFFTSMGSLQELFKTNSQILHITPCGRAGIAGAGLAAAGARLGLAQY